MGLWAHTFSYYASSARRTIFPFGLFIISQHNVALLSLEAISSSWLTVYTLVSFFHDNPCFSPHILFRFYLAYTLFAVNFTLHQIYNRTFD